MRGWFHVADEKVEEARRALATKLLEDIQEKGLNWSRDWCRGNPFNPTTGKAYHGRNSLFLMYAIAQGGYSDPRFMTFAQAKKEGYRIKKGCHGWPIEKWKGMWYLVAEPSQRIKQPRTAKEVERMRDDPAYAQRLSCVGTYTVFNAEDVEGIEPYEGAPRIERSEIADFLVKNPPCRVKESVSDNAFYRIAASRPKEYIQVPLRSQFTTIEGFARTLLHEMGHATGAPSRLNRDMTGTMHGDEETVAKYAREELVAELSSVFMANEIMGAMPEVDAADQGMDYLKNSAAYLKGWAARTKDPAGEILKAATQAAAAADWMQENRFAPALAGEIVIADVCHDLEEGRDVAPAVLRAAFADLGREGVVEDGVLSHEWAGYPAGCAASSVEAELGLAYPYGLDGLRDDCAEEAASHVDELDEGEGLDAIFDRNGACAESHEEGRDDPVSGIRDNGEIG